MERNINKKIDLHNQDYKEFIKQNFIELDEFISINTKDTPTKYDKIRTCLLSTLQKCYDYKKISLNKDDFQKRKRIKNTVSLCERCCACRANKEQCTRRKKDGSDFCGTHIKGVPHGVIEDKVEASQTNKKGSVWAQDIKGIMYYIDDNDNVYKTEDIMKNAVNPKVIAKYSTLNNADTIEYSITTIH